MRVMGCVFPVKSASIVVLLAALVFFPAQAMTILRIDDVWPFELACRYPKSTIYRADGGLLLRAKDGILYTSSGAQEAQIRQCDRIHDRTGSLLARRDAGGRYYLASGAALGCFDEDGNVYAAGGELVLRIRDRSVYLPSGRLLARFVTE